MSEWKVYIANPRTGFLQPATFDKYKEIGVHIPFAAILILKDNKVHGVGIHLAFPMFSGNFVVVSSMQGVVTKQCVSLFEDGIVRDYLEKPINIKDYSILEVGILPDLRMSIRVLDSIEKVEKRDPQQEMLKILWVFTEKKPIIALFLEKTGISWSYNFEESSEEENELAIRVLEVAENSRREAIKKVIELAFARRIAAN